MLLQMLLLLQVLRYPMHLLLLQMRRHHNRTDRLLSQMLLRLEVSKTGGTHGALLFMLTLPLSSVLIEDHVVVASCFTTLIQRTLHRRRLMLDTLQIACLGRTQLLEHKFRFRDTTACT
jgi:hypothetical protein